MFKRDEVLRGYRNVWLLVAVLLVAIAVRLAVTYFVHHPGTPRDWSMGGRDFVPGQSRYGVGYPPDGPPQPPLPQPGPGGEGGAR